LGSEWWWETGCDHAYSNKVLVAIATQGMPGLCGSSGEPAGKFAKCANFANFGGVGVLAEFRRRERVR
jgi:hypothetical protein